MLKDLVILTGFSTFVVVVIIGLNLYHEYRISTVPINTQEHVIPINPTFDLKTIDSLKKRSLIQVNLQDKSSIVSKDTINASSGASQSVAPVLPIKP